MVDLVLDWAKFFLPGMAGVLKITKVPKGGNAEHLHLEKTNCVEEQQTTPTVYRQSGNNDSLYGPKKYGHK